MKAPDSFSNTISNLLESSSIMSQRFPPLTSGDATSLTSELDVEIKKVFGDISTKFMYKDKNGAPVGPFAVLAQVSLSLLTNRRSCSWISTPQRHQ